MYKYIVRIPLVRMQNQTTIPPEPSKNRKLQVRTHELRVTLYYELKI